MRKIAITFISLLCLVAVSVPAAAGAGEQFPSEIDLPDGFFPEGIAVGRGTTFYVGSLADGSIYKGDLRTGEGAVFTEPTEPFPQSTLGLDVDGRNRIWASGGASGSGRVYNGTTGDLIATYQFTEPFTSLINDVIVTRDAAWFTDSGTQNCDPDIPGLCFAGEPRLFKVVLERGGRLPNPGDPGAIEEIPVNVPDIYFSNLNGIETLPGNSGLVVVHNELGALYRVDPASGEATLLYGPPNDPELLGPDGMSRRGRNLHVVENAASQISVIRLDRFTGSATLNEVLPVVGAQTPTTSALFGSAIYTVDARLLTPFVGPYKVFRIDL